MDKIRIPAFQHSGSPEFYNAITGDQLSDDFEGFCMVYFADGQTIFQTGINQYQERYWSAIGNNPHIPFEFI